VDECVKLAQHCIQVLKKKFLISQNYFTFKIVDKNGVRILKV